MEAREKERPPNCRLFLPKGTIEKQTCFGESRNEGAAVDSLKVTAPT